MLKFLQSSFILKNISPGDSGIDLRDFLTDADGNPIYNTFNTPASIVNLIISSLFTIAGLLLFIYIIAAGFSFFTAKSGNDMSQASDKITKALMGFGVMFAAYWITQLAQSITGIDILF